MRLTRLGPALIGLLAVVIILVSAPAFAAGPDMRDPTSILSWLKLQAMAVAVVVSVIWKYVPGLKDLSNRVILPWLQLLVFIVAVFGGTSVANAASPGEVVAQIGFWAKVGLVILNKAVSKSLWDGLLKPTLGDVLDEITRRKPQTP